MKNISIPIFPFLLLCIGIILINCKSLTIKTTEISDGKIVIETVKHGKTSKAYTLEGDYFVYYNPLGHAPFYRIYTKKQRIETNNKAEFWKYFLDDIEEKDLPYVNVINFCTEDSGLEILHEDLKSKKDLEEVDIDFCYEPDVNILYSFNNRDSRKSTVFIQKDLCTCPGN